MNGQAQIDWPKRLGVFALAVVLGGYVVWPSLTVVARSFQADPGSAAAGADVFTLDHWSGVFQLSNLRALSNSLVLSLISTLLAGIVGGLLAVFYTRWEFPGRALFAAAAILPLTLPPLVGVFAFWRLFSETGILSRLIAEIFGVSFSIERGWAGVYLVHAYSFSVYFYLLLCAAIRSLDASTFEAARNLGASRARLFFRVALPELTPAIVGASLLVFMTSMASFTAPWIYVSGRDVLTLNIVRARENNEMGQGAILCLLMTAASLVFLSVLMWWNARTKHYGAGKGAAPRPLPVTSPLGRAGLCALGATLTLVLATPHLYILLESFVRPGVWFLEIFPPEYTLENYAAIFSNPEFMQPVLVSLKAASAATMAVAAFGLLAAWMVVRVPFRGKKAVAIVAMLPWALPGTVIAVNLLEAFEGRSILTLGARLHGTVAILALAYFIRYIPLTYRSISASLETLDPNLELAAANLGASRVRTMARVTVPLVAPGLLAGTLLVFVTALGEFVSSILLYVSETMPIAVKIHDLLRVRYEMAAAYSVLLMGIIALTLLFSSKVLRAGGIRI